MSAIAKSARKTPPKSARSLPKCKQVGLRINPSAKSAWDQLPFVGKDHGKQVSCWDVPMTGGYFGGCEAGKIVARMYLKYVRDEHGKSMTMAATLLRSMLAGLDAKKPSSEVETDSVNGQRIGFIHELSHWIDAAAVRLGSSLDAIPQRSFIDQASFELSRDDASLMAAIAARGEK